MAICQNKKKEIKNKTENEIDGIEEDDANSISLSGFSNRFVTPSSNRITDSNMEYMKYMHSHEPSIRLKFKMWLYKKLYLRYFNPDDKKELTLVNLTSFFESLKKNINELDKKDIDDILNKYITVLQNAKDNNQVALIEKIVDYAKVLKYESVLCTSKFNKFLTEEDVVKFYNIASAHEKYKTKLCLTYTKNFVKIIPQTITELKKEADALKVFDNYVVLHYDYSGNSVKETKEEVEKRKDPVLFGIIQNSNRLYYIGDWVDDYCDLTLDTIIKKIGKTKKSIILNADSVKNNIDKI